MMSEITPNEYTDCPRTMEQCCTILRILYKHQVHREMIYAVSHLTAFHKSKGHVNKYYGVRTRRENNEKLFTSHFDRLVEEFLVSRRGGIIFFPDMIPHHKGYPDSYDEERLVWKYPKDQDLIRGGVALLIENLMMNAWYFDKFFIGDAIIWDSFVSSDCEDCGSGECGEENDIVYCDHCKIGHHQKCYNIFPLPLRHENWFCASCKEEGLDRPRSGPKPKPKLKTSPSEDDARSVITSVTSLRQASTKRMSSSPLSRENSAIESTKRSRLSMDGHSKAIDVKPGLAISTKGHSRKNSSIKSPALTTTANNRSRKNSVKSPGFVASGSSISRTNSTDMSASGSATPDHSLSLAATVVSKTFSALSMVDMKLAVRLAKEPVVRLVKFPAGSNVWDIFEVCSEAWPTKFLPQVHRILVRFDVIGGYLEIARPIAGADIMTAEADYVEFLELIKRVEKKPDEILYIPVLALAKGEIAPGL